MTRDEAIKYLIRPVSTSTVPSKEIEKQFEAYEMAIEALRKESDVHAHWEEIAQGRGKLYFKCSNCSTTFVPSHGLVYKYCFYCGAKMDEEVG